MIWVIDTSTPRWDSAVLEESGRVVAQYGSSMRPQLASYYRVVLAQYGLSKVAVATGPGSFTGTRVGVSFAVGLAMGLGIPIVPLPSLAIQAARSDDPVTAVIEAGRGRVYYLIPGGRPALGDPADVPVTYPLVGEVGRKSYDDLVATGHAFRPDGQLRIFGVASWILLETAREVPYRSLEIQYMNSFSAKG